MGISQISKWSEAIASLSLPWSKKKINLPWSFLRLSSGDSSGKSIDARARLSSCITKVLKCCESHAKKASKPLDLKVNTWTLNHFWESKIARD